MDTFLKIKMDTWKFINTFAPWFSAFGTFAAVVVSLYLARMSKQPKIRIIAGHRMMIEQGQKGPHLEFIMIKITNVGSRKINITGMGWKIGWHKKRYAIQLPGDNPLSSKIPMSLNDGEEATYFIPLKEENNWISNFVKDYIRSGNRIILSTLRVQVFTSIGRTFSNKFESGLRQMLLAEMAKQFK